jgi:hypothetical protein
MFKMHLLVLKSLRPQVPLAVLLPLASQLISKEDINYRDGSEGLVMILSFQIHIILERCYGLLIKTQYELKMEVGAIIILSEET